MKERQQLVRPLLPGLEQQVDVVALVDLGDVPDAVRSFVDRNRRVPKRVFCTYTAMLEVRAALGATRRVEAVPPREEARR